MRIASWRGDEVEVARSKGGVLAVVDPWQNVISTGVHPWPPPELIQKIYQSRQVRAFVDADLTMATSKLGFYSDLQSIHSEDAITWSAFGPVAYAEPHVRAAFVQEFLSMTEVPGSASHAQVWLWRRLPHPDTLVSGGPEIDFGIQTDDVFLLGEAKWRSSVGEAQGVDRDKDQVTLRREFCQKYGRRLLPGVRGFVVVGVSLNGDIVPRADTEEQGVALHMRDVKWDQIAAIRSHPCAEELRRYGASYESVKRFVRTIAPTRRSVGVFHCAPGAEAQVDFFRGAPKRASPPSRRSPTLSGVSIRRFRRRSSSSWPARDSSSGTVAYCSSAHPASASPTSLRPSPSAPFGPAAALASRSTFDLAADFAEADATGARRDLVQQLTLDHAPAGALD